MHSSEYNGYQFHYNGDYSGDIHITAPDGDEFTRTFGDIANVIYVGAYALDQPQVQAFREFVAEYAINEAISQLEQMETDEALTNPYLLAMLQGKSNIREG